jgi:hypothetical protein
LELLKHANVAQNKNTSFCRWYAAAQQMHSRLTKNINTFALLQALQNTIIISQIWLRDNPAAHEQDHQSALPVSPSWLLSYHWHVYYEGNRILRYMPVCDGDDEWAYPVSAKHRMAQRIGILLTSSVGKVRFVKAANLFDWFLLPSADPGGSLLLARRAKGIFFMAAVLSLTRGL